MSRVTRRVMLDAVAKLDAMKRASYGDPEIKPVSGSGEGGDGDDVRAGADRARRSPTGLRSRPSATAGQLRGQLPAPRAGGEGVSPCAARAGSPPSGRPRADRGDAAKGVVGRKRVALVDAEGTWLAVAVVPAPVRTGTRWRRWTRGSSAGPPCAKASTTARPRPSAAASGRTCTACRPRGDPHPAAGASSCSPGAGWWSGAPAAGALGRPRPRPRRPARRLGPRLACVGILSRFEALLDPMPLRAPAQ